MKTIAFKPTPKILDFRHRFLHTIYPHRFTIFFTKIYNHLHKRLSKNY